MQKYSISALLVLAFGAAFWAYTIIDTLIRDFHKDVSIIDLSALYVLGLISGVALGCVIVVRQKKNTTELTLSGVVCSQE
jgi:tellurite resistance protein TehA-like permease